MSIANINAKIELAVAAQESGDYAGAVKYLRSAKMYMAALPDSQSKDKMLRLDRQSIDKMIDDMDRLRGEAASESAAGNVMSVRRSKICWDDPSSCDC